MCGGVGSPGGGGTGATARTMPVSSSTNGAERPTSPAPLPTREGGEGVDHGSAPQTGQRGWRSTGCHVHAPDTASSRPTRPRARDGAPRSVWSASRAARIPTPRPTPSEGGGDSVRASWLALAPPSLDGKGVGGLGPFAASRNAVQRRQAVVPARTVGPKQMLSGITRIGSQGMPRVQAMRLIAWSGPVVSSAATPMINALSASASGSGTTSRVRIWREDTAIRTATAISAASGPTPMTEINDARSVAGFATIPASR